MRIDLLHFYVLMCFFFSFHFFYQTKSLRALFFFIIYFMPMNHGLLCECMCVCVCWFIVKTCQSNVSRCFYSFFFLCYISVDHIVLFMSLPINWDNTLCIVVHQEKYVKIYDLLELLTLFLIALSLFIYCASLELWDTRKRGTKLLDI